MDFLAQLREQYLEEFSNNVPLSEFLINLIVAAFLAALIRFYFIHFGHAISNRRRFAQNFLPLTLGTMLVIMIVKSSIALSLGLVGALSIVRFRAAIKDPEELVFLFLSIGVGLACGANHPLLATIALGVILLLLWLNRYVAGATRIKGGRGSLHINVHTDLEDLQRIQQILERYLKAVRLRRMEALRPGLDLTFTSQMPATEQLEALKTALLQLSPTTQFSVVDQPDLIV